MDAAWYVWSHSNAKWDTASVFDESSPRVLGFFTSALHTCSMQGCIAERLGQGSVSAQAEARGANVAMKRILIVDDEEMIVRTVKAYLDREGFKTYTAFDGEEALRAFDAKGPDLIVLDLMLPKVSGLEVCRSIRSKSSVPIIMLTAKASEADRVVGLELGADDYVVKPFSPRELVARIRAVLRRFDGEGSEVERIEAGSLSLDLKMRELKVDGKEVELTPTEFDLLAYLARHPGQVFTRLQLLREVQGYTYDSFARTVDTHVKNLRRKIEPDPKSPKYILTVHGVGYRFAREM